MTIAAKPEVEVGQSPLIGFIPGTSLAEHPPEQADAWAATAVPHFRAIRLSGMTANNCNWR